jgi:HEAT repeat protein
MARFYALTALGRMEDERSGELLRALFRAADGDDRLAAAEGLVARGDPTPTTYLLGLWKDTRDERALVLLARAADPTAFAELERRLRDPLDTTPIRHLTAIALLEAYPATRRSELLRHVAEDRSRVRDVRAAAWVLLMRGGGADEERDLVRLLRSEGPHAQEDRIVAALAMGELRRVAFARPLVEALGREGHSPESRTFLLRALALTGSEEGAETLVRAVVSDPSELGASGSIAYEIGATLAAAGPELTAALRPLVEKAVRGELGATGRRATFELLDLHAKCAGNEAAPTLERHLTHQDRNLRDRAAELLLVVHGPTTERSLRTAWWTRQDPYTRATIARALERLPLADPVR